MKSKIKNKKTGLVKSVDQKFIDEQAYAEQEFHLDDPSRDIPDYADENDIAEDSEKDTEEDTDREKITKKK